MYEDDFFVERENKMKKLFIVIICILSVLMLTGCNEKKEDEPAKAESFKVGVVQLVQHAALDAATQGFEDQLKKELGDSVTVDVQNASGDSANCSVIVNGFIQDGVDLIMANATPALQAAAAATGDIPILGTSVTEYGVALEIDDFNGLVGSNVSGTSDLAPLDEQAQMIIDLFPETKTVGILYCSAEANSIYQVKKVTEYLEAKGITVKAAPFADSNDIAATCEELCSNVDLIYVPTDNMVASCAETVANIVVPKKMPIIAGEEGICSICGVATLCINYYDLGVETGKMAAKILKGEAKIEEMEIQYFPNPVKKFNKEIAEQLGVNIPEDYIAIE